MPSQVAVSRIGIIPVKVVSMDHQHQGKGSLTHRVPHPAIKCQRIRIHLPVEGPHFTRKFVPPIQKSASIHCLCNQLHPGTKLLTWFILAPTIGERIDPVGSRQGGIFDPDLRRKVGDLHGPHLHFLACLPRIKQEDGSKQEESCSKDQKNHGQYPPHPAKSDPPVPAQVVNPRPKKRT